MDNYDKQNNIDCITVAQRLGEIVKKLNRNGQVDENWEPIVQLDGVVNIPEGVTIIAEDAFRLCTMHKVVFPKTLKHIGAWAFIGCKNLKCIDLPATYETIGKSAFEDSDLEGELPVFLSGKMIDPYREHIMGDSAFAKYWERNHCCPKCGMGLENEGYCSNDDICYVPRMELSEGIFLINGVMDVCIRKACTPDGDTRLSAFSEVNIEDHLSDKSWEMEGLLSDTRSCMTVKCNGSEKSHSLVASSWDCAIPAKVRVKNNQASVEMPFRIDTPENRKYIKSAFGLVPENGIAKVTFDTIYSKQFYGKCRLQDEIPIMDTDLGGMIRICKKCRCVQEPHFCYHAPNGKDYYLKFLKCDTCDYPADLEIKYRWDLQNSLKKPSAWKKIIDEWNLYNDEKVPLNQHIPFYVDLHTYGSEFFWEDPLLQGAQLVSYPEDEDPRPHFHFRHKDGGEAIICFGKPEYLEPSVRLSAQEKKDLIRFFSDPAVIHYRYGANTYGEILAYSWLARYDFDTLPDLTMPDYMLLPD